MTSKGAWHRMATCRRCGLLNRMIDGMVGWMVGWMMVDWTILVKGAMCLGRQPVPAIDDAEVEAILLQRPGGAEARAFIRDHSPR